MLSGCWKVCMLHLAMATASATPLPSLTLCRVSPDCLLLYSFIHKYRGLCEAHTVDFFTDDHWNGVIPESWRKDLLSIDTSNPLTFLNPNVLPECTLVCVRVHVGVCVHFSAL